MKKQVEVSKPDSLQASMHNDHGPVDGDDLDSAMRFWLCGMQSKWQYVQHITDEEIRRLLIKYRALVPNARWVQALISEDSVRTLRKARVERWAFLLISAVSGGLAGALVTWLLNRPA